MAVAAGDEEVSARPDGDPVTGGEPTLYPDLEPLLLALGRRSIRDLAMTTNGSLVTADAAARWKAAGLDRLTFSLDSLRDDRVRRLTRARTTLDAALAAIDAARAADLHPVKVNAVIMRDRNHDEILDFARFARERAVHVRLIEWMPLDSGRTWDRRVVVTASEMLERLRDAFPLIPVEGDAPDSTALNFRFADGAPGSVGIIASVTRPFCGACSRLRITADGKIRPCLFSHEEWDLRPHLRGDASDAQLRAVLVDAVWTKQRGHGIDANDFRPPDRSMSAIGG